jgi:hypothetical protein
MSGPSPHGNPYQNPPHPQQGGYPPQGHPQQPYPNTQPYGAPGQYPPPYRAYAKPHRGGMLLAFGICSFAVCVIFGIIAFFMAKTDLAEMKAGVMDPSGEGLTKAGYYLGMASMIFTALIIVLYIGIFAVMAASGGFR